jgi:hypothetical protein
MTNVSALMHLMAPILGGLREDSRQAEIEITFYFQFYFSTAWCSVFVFQAWFLLGHIISSGLNP